MQIKAIRGTKDILPQDSQLWRSIEEKAKSLSQVYGYRQIRTPILEEARLFVRSIGKSSDIVRKEMYAFLDRKKRLLCLRPEATASVVRAYLEYGLDKSVPLAKFYYFGPMFRAERPQAGRLRQFHHIGVEAIGSSSPYLDAEVISLAVRMLEKIGLEGFRLHLNSIGCQKDRQKYKSNLKTTLKKSLKSLCADCRNRYKVNLLRIFDCKNPLCKKIITRLPEIAGSLCQECQEHFSKVKLALKSLKIDYTFSPHLVRGLDYYTKTCFEITHPRLGAQNAVGAGGRYDNLVSDLGGPQKPAIGFSLGVERVIAALGPQKEEMNNATSPRLYMAAIGEEVKESAFKIIDSLRAKDITAATNYQASSLKAQMRQADKLGAKYVAILGSEELNKKTIILRDMQNKSQKEIGVESLLKELK